MRCSFPNRPFAPKRWPFFYGWVILVAGIIGTVMSAPGQTVGVSAFNETLIDVMALSREQLSLAYMLGTLSSGFLILLTGRLYDRFGARAVAAGAALTLALVTTLLSIVDRLAIAVANLGIPDTVAAVGVLALLFFLLRQSGQGLLTMVSRNMVMKWFHRRRGIASAVLSVTVGVAFGNTPPFFAWLIDTWDWRFAWQLVAIVSGIFFTMFVLIFFRDNPEDCDLVPDGRVMPAKDATQRADDEAEKRGVGLFEAMRTLPFWVFNLGLGAFSLYMTALTFHIESIFAEHGLDKSVANSIFLPAALAGIGISFLVGYLADRIQLKYCLLVLTIGIALSCLGVANLGVGIPPTVASKLSGMLPFTLENGSTPWGYGLVVLGGCMAGGSFGVLLGITWPRFYGRAHLGSISSFNVFVLVIMSAVGPSLFARSEAVTGGYGLAAWIGFGCMLLLTGLALFANRPQWASPVVPDAEQERVQK